MALRVKKDILGINSINFFEIDRVSCEKACEITADIGLRGMDAIVIQITVEQNATLVSLDTEMVEKAGSLVKSKHVGELVRK